MLRSKMLRFKRGEELLVLPLPVLVKLDRQDPVLADTLVERISLIPCLWDGKRTMAKEAFSSPANDCLRR